MAHKHVCVEVCVDSVESAVAAVKGGATRLELCGNLALGGGVTPSMGLLRSVKRSLSNIEIMVMIRPRPGDFLYTGLELETMLEDIRLIKHEGAAGVVVGILCANGTVDTIRTRRLVEAARPMQGIPLKVTVEIAPSAHQGTNFRTALKAIGSIGEITRILTSGHEKSAPDGLETLGVIGSVALTMQPPITILPGSGINPNTVSTVIRTDWWKKFREIHLSGGQWIDGAMQVRKTGMGMGIDGLGEWGIWRTDAEQVRQVRELAEDALTQAV